MRNYPYIDPGDTPNPYTWDNVALSLQAPADLGSLGHLGKILYGTMQGLGEPGANAPWGSPEWNEDMDRRMMDLATGGVGGISRLVSKAPWGGVIKAFHNTTGQPVGQLGFKYRPGGANIQNISTEPWVQGQGYGREMLDKLAETAGSNIGVGSQITNSLGWWERMAKEYPAMQAAVDLAKRWR